MNHARTPKHILGSLCALLWALSSSPLAAQTLMLTLDPAAAGAKAPVDAIHLTLFDNTGDVRQQTTAGQHLEVALHHWKNYSTAYTRQYVQLVLYNRAGVVDIPRQTGNVAADVQMAHDWKPGTLDEAKIKRSGTEAGFKK